jgi:hypothetical protein
MKKDENIAGERRKQWDGIQTEKPEENAQFAIKVP